LTGTATPSATLTATDRTASQAYTGTVSYTVTKEVPLQHQEL
jgi:hypothetical protein